MRTLKILGLSLASLAAVVVSAPTMAQPYRDHDRHETYRDHGRGGHHDSYRDRRYHRPVHHRREVCRKERHHGRWVRVCHRR